MNITSIHSQILNWLLAWSCLFLTSQITAQDDPTIFLDFDVTANTSNYISKRQQIAYAKGIEGKALSMSPELRYQNLQLNTTSFDGSRDFTIQFWIKTSSDNPMVILSQKDFKNKGLSAQKNPGWALYSSGGTFAWSIGSGERRLNYERDNGEVMSINDGDWHQLTMTYSKEISEFRLYYDGHNKSIYKVNFDFSNSEPLIIGSRIGSRIGSVENSTDFKNNYSPDITSGLLQLQLLTDEFNKLRVEDLEDDELFDLIVDPEQLLKKKQSGTSKLTKEDLEGVFDIKSTLVSNPYTVYQNRALTNLKPISKIYTLQNGKVIINESAGKHFTQNERLYPSNFDLDNLSIWDRTLSGEEVLISYSKFQKSQAYKLPQSLKELTVGVWNIWHGGIHWTKEKDGWDSRMRIVEMIREKNLDVVLMQETYSSGDFIAAELGYYYATTSDWDYRYQGSNISVLSRYPISEVAVSEETEFNNVGVKLKISETQNIWAMSNWYGMNQFSTVFDFHKSRFANADNIPIVFAGDFNAVPHTDGGDSPASMALSSDGFTDAFRSLFPDVKRFPGATHRNGERIDQLYYKGIGLTCKSTEVISKWPTGFPSDHNLIVSKFELDYSSN